MQEKDEIFTSLRNAGKYCGVGRQAIFIAIKKGKFKAEIREVETKAGGTQKQWHIERKNLDEYRANKYVADKKMFNGEKLYDMHNNRWSVLQISKALTKWLGIRIPAPHIYYLLRRGELKGSKRGAAWVVSWDEVYWLYESELAKIPNVARKA